MSTRSFWRRREVLPPQQSKDATPNMLNRLDAAGPLSGKVGKTALLLLGMLILFPALQGRADEFHYTNQLIGNRAAGMGGAYTAISDDPSGLYHNPAGIVYSQASNLTASVNAFSVGEKRYKAVLGGIYDWERESYSLLPNFFGIIQPLGEGVLGMSYAVPDSLIEDQDQQFNDDFPSSITGVNIDSYTININKKDNTYKFGPSYAVGFGPNLSVGLTLYFHYREKDFIKNEYVLLDNTTTGNSYKDFEWTSFYYETFEYGYEPILGVMWSPIDRLSLGLKISQTQIFYSDTTSQNTFRSEIQGTVTNNATNMVNRDDKREQPLNVTLGLAWFASDTILFSSDLSWFSSTADAFFGDKQSVLDLALGLEWYMNPRVALRTGVFTQNANTKEVEAGLQNQDEHLNYYGGSVSLSRFSRNSSITGGFTYSMGSGDAQVFANDTSIQEVEGYNYTIYLSTSYSY